MFKQFELNYVEWLNNFGLYPQLTEFLRGATVLAIILVLAWVSNFLTKRIIVSSIKRYAKKSKNEYDDIFVEKGVFTRLSHIAPALVIYYLISRVFIDSPMAIGIIHAGIKVYVTIIGILVADSFMSALHDVYNTFAISKNRPIKGYIQIAKILIYFVGVIFIISFIFNKSPFALMAGLGAMAAVLMLVFKDTILGFVASIQLSANDMLKIGDWITMSKWGVDGVVTEINLNTVKIKNFDQTITTLPTYNMVSEAFINWKGMEEGEGRRVKRAFYIDVRTIRFCNEELFLKLKNIKSISGEVEKQMELWKECSQNGNDSFERLTNLGVFRKYADVYLQSHPSVNETMSFALRERDPDPYGLPMELYYFSKNKDFKGYAGIQSEILEHVIAMLPEFGLAVFQSPSGYDYQTSAQTVL